MIIILPLFTLSLAPKPLFTKFKLAMPTNCSMKFPNQKSKQRTRRATNKRPPPSSENEYSRKESDDVFEDVEDFGLEDRLRIRASLLRWYDKHRRELPWRSVGGGSEEDRAYAVWVSEVMLQQTRVVTVIDYYNRWMDKWPTVRDLATASQEEVNEMWAGLGYYRRARFLLEGAKSIVEAGKFPQTASGLRNVRGIGNYTAGAIASIAFNEEVPVVDGNVIRVICRLKAISANPKVATTTKDIWKLAGQLVDPSRPGDFNQAMMELGATLCSVSNPRCSACPISNQCVALSLSRNGGSVKVTDYPIKVAKAKQRKDFAAVCVIQLSEASQDENNMGSNRDLFILVKRPEEGLLAGLWEFPSVLLDEESVDIATRRKAMNDYIKKIFDINLERDCSVIFREDVGKHIHIFSHIRLHMHVELLILTLKGGLSKFCKGEDQGTWKCVDLEYIKTIGLTSGVRKVYNMVQDFKQKCLSLHPISEPRKKFKK